MTFLDWILTFLTIFSAFYLSKAIKTWELYVEGGDVRLSHSSFTLAGISNVSTCERSKPAASLIGQLKRKPSEVVDQVTKLSKTNQKNPSWQRQGAQHTKQLETHSWKRVQKLKGKITRWNVKGVLINMTRAWDKEKSESPTGLEPINLIYDNLLRTLLGVNLLLWRHQLGCVTRAGPELELVFCSFNSR